jgi:transposase
VAQARLARSQKKAALERRELLFVDESGFYLLPGYVRTYAPMGHTPTLSVFQTRDHLSVMSAITPKGGLFTLTRTEALTGVESVLFLNHLHGQVCRKLLVIWDGSPIHRGVCVRDFLLNGGSKFVHLERLPAYAPDLNPDEGTWHYLKHVEMRNLCCLNLCHLRDQLSRAVIRLRRKDAVIRSFFTTAGLKID